MNLIEIANKTLSRWNRELKENIEYVYEVTEITDDMLDESAGNLKGLPGSMIKAITKSDVRGGKDSNVEDHGRMTSHSKLKSTLHNITKDPYKVAVLHHNGKPIASIHTSFHATGTRSEYGVNTPEGTSKTTKHVVDKVKKYSPSGNPYTDRKHRSFPTLTHTKDDAINKAMYSLTKNHINDDMTDKDTYKKHEFTVKSYSRDPKRAEISKERKDNKKSVRDNDNLNTIKDKALDKLADRHVKGGSPIDNVKNIHKKLGDAIEAGDHKAAREHLAQLDHHTRYSDSLKNESPYKKQYKDAVKDLKGWSKDYGRNRIKDMKDKGVVEDYYIESDEYGEGNIINIINENTVEVMFEHGSEFIELDEISIQTLVNEGRPKKDGSSDDPRQHIMQQLQRAKLSMNGGSKVTFKDGSSHMIPNHHANKILDRYNSMKPSEKLEFQKMISSSHDSFKNAL